LARILCVYDMPWDVLRYVEWIKNAI
jgi:hypothetical protein